MAKNGIRPCASKKRVESETSIFVTYDEGVQELKTPKFQDVIR